MLNVQKITLATRPHAGETILAAAPSARSRVLLSSYLLNLWRGPDAVRDMIVADFCAATDLGASAQAADLLLVLRQFLEDWPEAGLVPCACLRQW
ncbi:MULTISPECIES: hypothetical protein [Methylocystis]|uniref:hypothetical protein n=1 Tax=Methylocystis TaxID=133 RepID=UPI001922F912|nr:MULTISPECIES: hypothetical protein [Methylocystis]MBL1258001.1 hypothetical protein [Methylocystis sp. Sn-Cys]